MDADAIVIGAGAAGLAAAQMLASRSLRVIAIEARDRIGGRAWSTVCAGTSIELGAEFIHGPAAETRALLASIGAPSIPVDGESWSGKRGTLVRADRDFAGAGEIFAALDALSGDESVSRFLRRFANDEAKRKLAVWAREFVEGFDAADPSTASVRGIATEWASGVNSVIARPQGGYQPVIGHLQKAVQDAGVQTYRSSIVRRVRWQPGEVAIEVESPLQGSRTLGARLAIVTLPIGILRHRGDRDEVTFEPRLPESTSAAIAHLEMGHAIRIGLVFKTAFWEGLHGGRYRSASFFRTAGQPFPAYWTQFPTRRNYVVAWAGGPHAIALHDVAPDERIALALDGFAALFGESRLVRAEFEAAVTHDWTHDPFARGAYSYVTVGGSEARDVLARPVQNTLFFAGEATAADGQGGTVNGALASGARSAELAVAALGVSAAKDG